MSRLNVALTLLVALQSAGSFISAHAQGPAIAAAVPPAVRDPGDPRAAVPPARYASAFARYRPNEAVEVGVWRDSNDKVGRLGGWRHYGKEAIADESANEPAAIERTPDGKASKPAHGQRH